MMPGRNPYAPDMRPMTVGLQHSLCVEHIPVDGLEFPVCVLKGQDREKVLQDVADVLGMARLVDKVKDAGVHGAELSHPTPRTARRPIPDSTPRPPLAPGAGSDRYRARRRKYGPGGE